jgi:DNA-binding MarR family transcriptional regulator
MTAVDVEETARRLRLVVGQLVRRTRSGTAGAAGLPPALVATLGWLDRDGPMTTSGLAGLQLVKHQSAARVVSLLARDGLVRLTPHPTDGRMQLVTITTAGRRALTRQREQRVEWLAELIGSRLTPAEQRTLARSTELLARLIEP